MIPPINMLTRFAIIRFTNKISLINISGGAGFKDMELVYYDDEDVRFLPSVHPIPSNDPIMSITDIS